MPASRWSRSTRNWPRRSTSSIGDQLTIGLLGVERTARIASFRRIDWDSMGFNYVLVFSPNAIADAPHNLAATIDLPAAARRSGGLLRKLVRAFPVSLGDRDRRRCCARRARC